MADLRRIHMHEMLIRADNNFTRASDLYQAVYGEPTPSRQSFQRLSTTIALYGQLKAPRRPRERPVADARRQEILTAIENQPVQSVRGLARHLGIIELQ